MSEEQELDFSNINRNDPCPCGSGKKFKKCHYRKLETLKQVEEQTANIGSFIRAGQLPYQFFKGLRMLVNRRDWGVMYEAFQPDTSIAQTYPAKADFVQVARDSPSSVPLGGEPELRRLRTLDDRAFIMVARDRENRRATKVQYEVLALIDTEQGYRITDIEHQALDKAGLNGDPEFDTFACVKQACEAALAQPPTRPEFERAAID